MLRKYTLFSLLCLFCSSAVAQEWNGKKSAVVLTYDDALNVHMDIAIPALDSLNLKGTFFLTTASPAFSARLDEWKKAAGNNHELANHTLFHPCNGSLPGRSFVKPEYDLSTYTVRRIEDEIQATNTVLQAIDGKKDRTFAYPCGDTEAGGLSYVDAIKNDFVAARGVNAEMVTKGNANLYNVNSFMINGQTGEEMIQMVKKATEEKSMIVFLFHGVGGEHGLNVSAEAHSQLLHYLKEHEKDIWNTTFIEAANYLKNQPKGK